MKPKSAGSLRAAWSYSGTSCGPARSTFFAAAVAASNAVIFGSAVAAEVESGGASAAPGRITLLTASVEAANAASCAPGAAAAAESDCENAGNGRDRHNRTNNIIVRIALPDEKVRQHTPLGRAVAAELAGVRVDQADVVAQLALQESLGVFPGKTQHAIVGQVSYNGATGGGLEFLTGVAEMGYAAIGDDCAGFKQVMLPG